jgi:NitT/TauT family transport system ATP-binding protein
MNALTVKGVTHWFGDITPPKAWAAHLPGLVRRCLPRELVEGTKRNKVLFNINLTVKAGQILALVGPSGCGKSTLLRAILGTDPPCKGKVYSGGVREKHRIISPSRNVGIVYQNYFLYPFLTAQANVALGLKLDETTLFDRAFKPWYWWPLRKKHLQAASDWLEKLGLGHAINKYPRQLSGGMRQRVAIAQALIMKPKILLLDEPFGALDEATREELQMMLLQLYAENETAMAEGKEPPYTILIVTHELNEAFYVSDRVVGLSQFHDKGHEGATIVYDKAAPVFRPDDPREFGIFLEQREELRREVFDSTNLQNHKEFVTFWQEHEKAG